MSLTSKKYILLFATLLKIVLIDRLLLLNFELPLWEWDEKLHYKHRRNITRNWNDYNKKPIIINEYGQHDDSYPLRKGERELRILNLGDSITMGHGVTKDETYSKYLEIILSDSLKNFQTIQAINTGVQGYSTFQELEVLRNLLYLQPDFVTLGFCLNDITEPFKVNKNLGGTGLDYHRVTQAQNKFLSYIINETGFGRLIQEIRIRQINAHQAKDDEINEIKKMLLHKDDTVYQAQFNFTLNKLSEIISLCNDRGISIIILIFPYTFQVDSNLRWVQDILRKELNEHGVPCIDFLELFENITRSDANKLKQYYLDEDHLTPFGHKIVAMEISKIIFNELRSTVH
ncbi:MAG TPA: SGNH/GDSL hydrolase family protein [Ignavibacteriaceae bacterium]|nr:SGNH/GDSL hydrolase family protein [Ignavibacteriaceae bacterium]